MVEKKIFIDQSCKENIINVFVTLKMKICPI